MNSTPPVSRAQPSSDAVQPNAADPAAAGSARAAGQDFAATLSALGKPARKSGAIKRPDAAANGSPLPARGNQPPLAPPPVPTAQLAPTPLSPAKPDALTAVTAGSAADDTAADDTAANHTVANETAAIASSAKALRAPGGSAGLRPSIAAALTAQPDASGATTLLTPEIPGAAAAAPTPVAAAKADAATPAAVRNLATSGTSIAPTSPAAPAGNAAKLRVAAAGQWITDSANSTPPSGHAASDSTLSGEPATVGIDAVAPSLMASATAQGASAPAPEPAIDALPTSDSVPPSGAAAPEGAAAAAAADAASLALTAQSTAAVKSAAVSAATAASTQLVFAASSGAADKRAHGNSAEAMLSSATNDGSAGAAQLLTSNTATDGAPTPTFKVAAGVDTAQFGQGVADRISLMLDGNLTGAKLQVNPPALGPIEVRIALQGGHAQVSFSSHSALTRDALQSSSEKLREMLGSQGFSSVSVDISRRSFQERSPQSQAYESAPATAADAPVQGAASVSISRSASGLLDAYA